MCIFVEASALRMFKAGLVMHVHGPLIGAVDVSGVFWVGATALWVLGADRRGEAGWVMFAPVSGSNGFGVVGWVGRRGVAGHLSGLLCAEGHHHTTAALVLLLLLWVGCSRPLSSRLCCPSAHIPPCVVCVLGDTRSVNQPAALDHLGFEPETFSAQDAKMACQHCSNPGCCLTAVSAAVVIVGICRQHHKLLHCGTTAYELCSRCAVHPPQNSGCTAPAIFAYQLCHMQLVPSPAPLLKLHVVAALLAGSGAADVPTEGQHMRCCTCVTYSRTHSVMLLSELYCMVLGAL